MKKIIIALTILAVMLTGCSSKEAQLNNKIQQGKVQASVQGSIADPKSEESELLNKIYGKWIFDTDNIYSFIINEKEITVFENDTWMDISYYELQEVNTKENYIVVKIVDQVIEGELEGESSSKEFGYLDKLVLNGDKLTYITHFGEKDNEVKSDWNRKIQ